MFQCDSATTGKQQILLFIWSIFTAMFSFWIWGWFSTWKKWTGDV